MKPRYWLPGALFGVLVGCAWLQAHQPTSAEKAKAAAVARCVASAVQDSTAGAGGQP